MINVFFFGLNLLLISMAWPHVLKRSIIRPYHKPIYTILAHIGKSVKPFVGCSGKMA